MTRPAGAFASTEWLGVGNEGEDMDFKIREVGNSKHHYADVVAVDGGTRIELGLLDKTQRRALADKLQAAVDDLLFGLPDEERA